MKLLLVAVLIFAGVWTLDMSSRPDHKADQKQNDSSDKRALVNTGNTQEHEQESSKQEHPSSQSAVQSKASIIGPEWLSAIAAVITLISSWQSYETRRAASASKESAEAFINKERARFFISHQVTADFTATFKAINQGQSPAQMIYSFVGCHILKADEKFPAVPDYTEGDDPKTYVKNTWVLPSDDVAVGWYDASYISEKENPGLFEDVMSGTLLLWFYGVVRYIDSVSLGQHELRFCYRCWPEKSGRHFMFEGGPETYRSET